MATYWIASLTFAFGWKRLFQRDGYVLKQSVFKTINLLRWADPVEEVKTLTNSTKVERSLEVLLRPTRQVHSNSADKLAHQSHFNLFGHFLRKINFNVLIMLPIFQHLSEVLGESFYRLISVLYSPLHM